MTNTYYVSPNGNDKWSGTKPDTTHGDGPFATIARAQQAVRDHKKDGALAEAAEIVLRGGTYFMDEPMQVTPEDSGSPPPTDGWNIVTGPPRAVTYRAFRNERPVVSGGRRITGFRPTSVNGVEAWSAEIPEVASGSWTFTQLWVNGRRALRPRLPRDGRFVIEEPLGSVVWDGDVHEVLFTGQDEFRFAPGDLKPWRNVEDVEFVALHYWIESRIRFRSIDEASRVATLQWKSRMRLTDDFQKGGAPYYVENVFEALMHPGEFYLDRPTGTLYYIPREGESIDDAEVVAPRLSQILHIGDDTASRGVHDVVFEGVEFSHTEWVPGEEAFTATPQAACHVAGGILVSAAYDIQFHRCRFTHLGGYGVEITDGSHDVAIIESVISDLGGGGVKVWHSGSPQGEKPQELLGAGVDWYHSRTCRRVMIRDNYIYDGGYRFHQAVGVLIGKCSAVQLQHNSIHDFDYSGVSVGWTWGYQDGEAYGNLIEHNHIYNIGRGMLSDMGGIYTLGVQPGTRLRYNVIHDVRSRGYGGWGIYNDEGSSYILVENNVVFRTKSNGYNQHYGRDNLIQNNIFAYGGEAQFSRGRLEPHNSFIFRHNIIFFDGESGVLAGNWKQVHATIDWNLYWNVRKSPLTFAGDSFDQWRERGSDQHSLVANPGFFSPEQGDFHMRDDSPARQIGFRPFDVGDVGPRIPLDA